MKTILLQAGSNRFRIPLRKLVARHDEYCQKWDIVYQLQFGRVVDGRNPIWDRLNMIQNALREGYDLIVYMDVDSIIVDQNVSLRAAALEFVHIGAAVHKRPFLDKPWHYNNGVMFIRNTHKVHSYFHEVREIWHGLRNEDKKPQFQMLNLDLKHQVFARIDDKWNSTVGVNEAEEPVIKSWHAQFSTFLLDNRLKWWDDSDDAIQERTNRSVLPSSQQETRPETQESDGRLQEDGSPSAEPIGPGTHSPQKGTSSSSSGG